MHVSNIDHHSPLGKSDHDLITFEFDCYVDYPISKDSFAYDKRDYNAMKNYLRETNWMENITNRNENETVDGTWNALKEQLLELRDKFVPIRNISGKTKWTTWLF